MICDRSKMISIEHFALRGSGPYTARHFELLDVNGMVSLRLPDLRLGASHWPRVAFSPPSLPSLFFLSPFLFPYFFLKAY